jgi:hypothetical protein
VPRLVVAHVGFPKDLFSPRTIRLRRASALGAFRLAQIATLLCQAACARGDSTAPSRVTSIAITSGPTLSGTVATVLAPEPTFVVRDVSGNVLGGVPVTINITGGGGSLANAPSQTADGPTAIGTWTLGQAVGENVAVVSAAGLPPLAITATAVADIPSTLSVASGNDQSAFGGVSLTQPVTFKLADRYGNGIANAVVHLIVTAGEGQLLGGSPSSTTNQAGVATVPTWTLGKLAVPQQLAASVGNIQATASAVVSTQFHAEVRFFGPPLDSVYRPAFTRAINRLNAEVIGQLTPVSFTNEDVANTCGVTGVAPLNEQIESLVIYASVGAIDGAGGIVASSGPCYVRQTDKLTVVGTMTFDAADLPTILNNGQLNDVVFHEMQHVLGFGTLWATVVPMLIVNAGTPETGFTGAVGIRGCQQAGGVSADCVPSIPLENIGGVGTADEHWRWSIFGNELMTAVLPPPGTPKLLSVMTIGSITDLGYQTNGNVADAYTIPSSVAASYTNLQASLGFDISRARDVVLRPRFTVTRDGVVSRMR